MTSKILKSKKNFRWSGVPIRHYKETGDHFKNIVRQTLLGGDLPGLNFSARYFEIAPGGYSSLETHRHVHVVFIVRGKGSVQLDKEQYRVKPFDCVYISPRTVHQFRPIGREPLGFLCFVDQKRDAPKAVKR